MAFNLEKSRGLPDPGDYTPHPQGDEVPHQPAAWCRCPWVMRLSGRIVTRLAASR